MQQTFNLLVFSCMLFISLAHADNAEEISFKDLPDVIQQSARRIISNEAITLITHSVKGSNDYFTLTSHRNGKSKSVTFAKDGTIIDTQQLFTKQPGHGCDTNNEHDFYADVEGYKQNNKKPDCRLEQ